MEIHGGFSTQRVIETIGKERRKCHATEKEARESKHRQG